MSSEPGMFFKEPAPPASADGAHALIEITSLVQVVADALGNASGPLSVDQAATLQTVLQVATGKLDALLSVHSDPASR